MSRRSDGRTRQKHSHDIRVFCWDDWEPRRSGWQQNRKRYQGEYQKHTSGARAVLSVYPDNPTGKEVGYHSADASGGNHLAPCINHRPGYKGRGGQKTCTEFYQHWHLNFDMNQLYWICPQWLKQNKEQHLVSSYTGNIKAGNTSSIVKVCILTCVRFALQSIDALKGENDVDLRRNVTNKCHAGYCP